MAAESAMSPVDRAVLIAAAALALYVGAYFPAMSYVARHSSVARYPRSPSMILVFRPWPASAVLVPWRALPHPVWHALLDVWIRLDPVGADLLMGWR